MDAESLQKSERRRGRCLDVFLVVSIMFLFAALTAVVAGGVMYVRDLQSRLDSALPSLDPALPDPAKRIGETSDSGYKKQNFAYLDAESSKLQTCTLSLAPRFYGTGTSVGSNFVFNKQQNSLKPLKEGTYFLYINLNVTCTYDCSAGVLTVSVNDKLTCEVKLPDTNTNTNTTSVSRKCWTVVHLNDQNLNAQMTVPKAGLKNWKLELKGSGIGMFHVD